MLTGQNSLCFYDEGTFIVLKVFFHLDYIHIYEKSYNAFFSTKASYDSCCKLNITSKLLVFKNLS